MCRAPASSCAAHTASSHAAHACIRPARTLPRFSLGPCLALNFIATPCHELSRPTDPRACLCQVPCVYCLSRCPQTQGCLADTPAALSLLSCLSPSPLRHSPSAIHCFTRTCQGAMYKPLTRILSNMPHVSFWGSNKPPPLVELDALVEVDFKYSSIRSLNCHNELPFSQVASASGLFFQ